MIGRLARAAAVGTALALGLAGCVAEADEANPAAQDRSIGMDQGFSCTASDRVEPARRAAICAGFLAALRQAYPKVNFGSVAAGAEGPGLELRILRASGSGAMLQLVWTDAAGRVTEGREAGLSVMDRAMSEQMLNGLFQRALADTPMP